MKTSKEQDVNILKQQVILNSVTMVIKMSYLCHIDVIIF